MIYENEIAKESCEKRVLRILSGVLGKEYKISVDKNRRAAEAVLRALEAESISEHDAWSIVGKLRDFAEERKDEDPMAILYGYAMRIMEDYPKGAPFEKRDEAPAQESDAPESPERSLSLLEETLMRCFLERNSQELRNAVGISAEKMAREFIEREYGPIKRTIEVTVKSEDAQKRLSELPHRLFKSVYSLVQSKIPVFLTGPAGCGKNVLCRQIAESMGLPFHFSNAVTQEYKITGFTDANGVYHETEFYRAFKDGGLFMLDEIDASVPEVLVTLNAALANGYFDFPAPIGYVEANKDFRVIAAGNTYGLGADYEYIGRNQLDAASLDRFAVVEMDYDRDIEMSVANGDEELVSFVESFRKASEEAGVKVLATYRAIGRIEALKDTERDEIVLKWCLVKGLIQDDINMILSKMKVSGRWVQALRALAA